MKRKQAGFTLIEVLVAITLMALVSIMAWRGLENVSSQQRRLSADADENDAIIRMLGQLERDFAQRAPNALLAIPTTTPETTLLPQSVLVSTTGQPDSSATIELIRSDAANPGAWQRVVWFQDGNVLRRAAGQSATQYPLPPAGRGADILGSVQRFSVRGWVPGQGWIPTPFPTTGVPFGGLELTVTRLGSDGQERYSRVVVLD